MPIQYIIAHKQVHPLKHTGTRTHAHTLGHTQSDKYLEKKNVSEVRLKRIEALYRLFPSAETREARAKGKDEGETMVDWLLRTEIRVQTDRKGRRTVHM